MRKLGLFVDVSNVYYTLRPKKLSYKKLIKFVEQFGQIVIAQAYGAQLGKEAQNFLHCLRRYGYTSKYRKPVEIKNGDKVIKRKANWDVGITIDIVEAVLNGSINTLILCSSDSDFIPLIQWCRNKGIKVLVIACQINNELASSVDHAVEIPPSLLEEK